MAEGEDRFLTKTQSLTIIWTMMTTKKSTQPGLSSLAWPQRSITVESNMKCKP